MADNPKYLNLSFLGDDVRNQIVHSRELLGQIKVLQNAAERMTDPEGRKSVEESIHRLLEIVRDMNANIAFTTTTGTTTLGPSLGAFATIVPAPRKKEDAE